jgi:hypothetical protein
MWDVKYGLPFTACDLDDFYDFYDFKDLNGLMGTGKTSGGRSA